MARVSVGVFLTCLTNWCGCEVKRLSEKVVFISIILYLSVCLSGLVERLWRGEEIEREI